MLKKCITLVLALMMVATMLGGCAPEAQTETPSETESATASEEAAPSSEASEEKLTFGSYGLHDYWLLYCNGRCHSGKSG